MYSYRLTEEIARWAFEIKCLDAEDWFVAFTNPTAGPWKTIKIHPPGGIEEDRGEVYRFASDEKRPDIILVNDVLQMVIVFEAKDILTSLNSGNQADKSIEVVANLAQALKKKKNSKFWGIRYSYSYYTGILWGNTGTRNKIAINSVFDAYHNAIKKYSVLRSDVIIGVESKKLNENISCEIIFKTYGDGVSMPENQKKIIAESLGLPPHLNY